MRAASGWPARYPTVPSARFKLTHYQQARAFVTFSLRPWLVAIEQALGADADLFPPEQRTYPAFELEGLLRGDPAQRAAFYTAALNPQTGWMDRSEVRRLEDLPAESGSVRGGIG